MAQYFFQEEKKIRDKSLFGGMPAFTLWGTEGNKFYSAIV